MGCLNKIFCWINQLEAIAFSQDMLKNLLNYLNLFDGLAHTLNSVQILNKKNLNKRLLIHLKKTDACEVEVILIDEKTGKRKIKSDSGGGKTLDIRQRTVNQVLVIFQDIL